MQWPKQVTIIEVGPRDGLQNEKAIVPTERKLELLNLLARAGVRRIQVTSFVHPRVVPQLADAEELMRRLERIPGVQYSALIPNEKGYERALAAGVREVDFVIGVSETFNRRNVNMSTEESLERCLRLVERARRDGVHMRVGLATSFGCPYEGRVPPERVLRLARRVYEAGANEIGISDTNGVAHPRQVFELFSMLVEIVPAGMLVAHFHDTWGRGLANVVASLQAGITQFDASIAGLGGCPFCPGASGNIATEDLVDMLHSCGVATGIDLQLFLQAADMAAGLSSRPVSSHVLVASRARCQLPPHKAPDAPNGGEP